MAEIKSLSVKLGADITGFTKGLHEASGKLNQFSDRAAKLGSTLSKTLTAGIAAAATGMVAMAVNAGKVADRILDLKDITGLTTDSIQEFQYVANQAGVSSEAFTKAAEGLSRRLVSLDEEGSKANDMMTALGVSVRNTDGSMKSSNEIMDQAIKALSNIQNPMERASAATQLFGRAASDMLPILGMGATEIDRLRNEAHELGIVMSGESLNGANDFRKGVDKLQATFKGIINQMGADFAPMLNDVILPLIQDKIVPLFQKFGEKVKQLTSWFSGLSAEGQKKILMITGVVAAIGPMLVILPKVIAFVKTLSVVFNVMGLKIMAVIAAIAALTAAFLYVRDNWDAIKERFSDVDWWRNALLEMTALVAEYNPTSLLMKGINELLTYFGANPIPNPFEGIADSIRSLKVETKEYEHEFGSFGDTVRNALDSITPSWLSVKGATKETTAAIVEGQAAINEKTEESLQLKQAELGLLTQLNQQLQEEIARRETLLYMDDIEQSNLRIKAIQDEIQALKDLGMEKDELTSKTNSYSSSMVNLQGVTSAVFDKGEKDALDYSKSILQAVKRSVAGFIAQSIAAAISAGASTGGPVAPITAASFGAAVAATTKTMIPALANGGMAYGNTLAMVGDNRNAIANPEVISPLDKLEGMFGGDFKFKIEGRDLIAVAQNENNFNNRFN
jgi:hypothetical protein